MSDQRRNSNIGMVGYGFMGRTHSNAFGKVNQFFDLDHQPVLKAVCARNAERAQGFARTGAMNPSKPIGASCVAREDIDLIDIATPNDTHAEIAIAAAQAGKMVMCEKPLGRNAAEAQKMVAAVEAADVPNMVWYNYRRVPAVTLAKQLIDEGRLGKHLSLSRQVPAGLDHLRRPAAGRRGTVAARRQRRRQRRHRRPARPLHRHGDVAQRPHRQGDRHDRDLHQGAQHTPHRQGREGDDRRRQRFPRPLSQRFAGHLRSDPLRARPQGALHARDQRRARLDHSGICTICIGCNISITATKAGCAAGGRCTSPTAIIPI